MKQYDVLTGSLTDLLRQIHDLLLQRTDSDAAIHDALLASIEAAVSLSKLNDRDGADPVSRIECLRDVSSCTRAIETVVRFAIVEAEDRRRRVRGRAR